MDGVVSASDDQWGGVIVPADEDKSAQQLTMVERTNIQAKVLITVK